MDKSGPVVNTCPSPRSRYPWRAKTYSNCVVTEFVVLHRLLVGCLLSQTLILDMSLE